MKKHIKIERTFNKSAAKIWEAISTGEELSKWFMECDFRPEVGYEYTFIQHHEGGGKSVINGKVLEVQPQKLLSYTWLAVGTTADTVVKWTLNEVGDSTQVIIEHESFQEESENPSIVALFADFEEGWGYKLKDLGEFIA